MDKLAVIMSVYKEKSEYVRLAIESILNQTYRDFEFVIVLDCPENTEIEALILTYQAVDDRIVLLKNEKNIGLAMSLNRGLEYTDCKLVARMDADDIAKPDRFEKQIACLRENPSWMLVATNRTLIDEEGKELAKGKPLTKDFKQICKKLEHGNIITHPSVLFYKDEVTKIQGYRNFPAAQDYDLWLRLVTSKYEFGFLDEDLMFYRTSNNNISVGKAYRQRMCNEYAYQMYKERVKKGRDSFSEENLNAYLDQNGCNDEKVCNRYKEGILLFNQSRNSIASKHYFKGFFLLFKAMTKHKQIRVLVWDIFKGRM